jgi:16S rRNA (uracil1498-N3)-methyltransferase
VTEVVSVARPAPLEVIVPVADRDRMLLAAEKCAELQVTAWRPAWFSRSRSVSPRGEGSRFRDKVVARMQAALEQSGGAWLPEVHPEASLPDALAAVSAPTRLVCDSSGTSLQGRISHEGIGLLVGPEGGFEPDELRGITAQGWVPVALASSVLRFETAIIAAVATVRALQFTR